MKKDKSLTGLTCVGPRGSFITCPSPGMAYTTIWIHVLCIMGTIDPQVIAAGLLQLLLSLLQL